MYDCSWTFSCDRSTACPFLGKKLPGFQLLSNNFLGWSSFVQHPFLDLSELLRFFRPWISLNFGHWWAKPMSWLKRWVSFTCRKERLPFGPVCFEVWLWFPMWQSNWSQSESYFSVENNFWIECPLLLVSVSFEHPANTSARLVVIILFGIKAKTGFLPDISVPTRLSLADDAYMVAFQHKNQT